MLQFGWPRKKKKIIKLERGKKKIFFFLYLSLGLSLSSKIFFFSLKSFLFFPLVSFLFLSLASFLVFLSSSLLIFFSFFSLLSFLFFLSSLSFFLFLLSSFFSNIISIRLRGNWWWIWSSNDFGFLIVWTLKTITSIFFLKFIYDL